MHARGGGGDFHIKMTGMLAGNFRNTPKKVPESCFFPFRGTNFKQHNTYSVTWFSAQSPKRNRDNSNPVAYTVKPPYEHFITII